MAKKKLSARAARRASDRDAEKLTRDLERLALLEPGHTPGRAIVLDAASQVEVAARAIPCPRCRGLFRVEDHTAETLDGVRLRVAKVVCSACGAGRLLYFRLGAAALN
ncbi:hypothetical protein SOCE26_054000 [Sorangium cellulosum]|uniref:Uncharacterized protein n=1 Tax=Sorangium cellulosum TaxID=56 RepID=A0A2L0EXA2_SORCE|nr:hypothetical protein [Sorangium cellulosum]AUX43944.1 hypothetical protein SOCE26_054000 [Sorangium cellulosum]